MLKKWRKDNGYKQDSLAKALGCHQSIISSYENNLATPSLKVAVKIEELTKGKIKCKHWIK